MKKRLGRKGILLIAKIAQYTKIATPNVLRTTKILIVHSFTHQVFQDTVSSFFFNPFHTLISMKTYLILTYTIAVFFFFSSQLILEEKLSWIISQCISYESKAEWITGIPKAIYERHWVSLNGPLVLLHSMVC